MATIDEPTGATGIGIGDLGRGDIVYHAASQICFGVGAASHGMVRSLDFHVCRIAIECEKLGATVEEARATVTAREFASCEAMQTAVLDLAAMLYRHVDGALGKPLEAVESAIAEYRASERLSASFEAWVNG